VKSEARLELAGVSKSFQLGAHAVVALAGVTLMVREGEMVALTGPSGSGKTTLLGICGLIETQDSGAVLLAGRDVGGLSDTEKTLVRRESVGYVFQGFNLVPVMSAWENVEYPLVLEGVAAKERKRRVDEILTEVGLAEHSKHKPDQLSGGQRQRVAIARALIKRPMLVVADEPTASLDSKTADQILSMMRNLGDRMGTSFLIATHDSRLTVKCNRVLSLLDGAIQ